MTHVLIVEDHEENRNLLKLLLEANGYRVTAAGDGLEALAAARRDPPDAIVSDALMPRMDGFALCRAWMQDAALKSIPFIFYSATYVHPEDEQFAMALGAVRYLTKPLEAEAFLGELRAVLQQWAGHTAPGPAAPLDDLASHALHESALARKVEDKMAQLEAANRKRQQNEESFRSLFEGMLNGVAYCRMQYDDGDCPVDFVYLKVNSAFERLTGLKNVVGRKVSEVIPGIRELSPELFEAYGRVASTGIPEAFEFDFKSMAKWLTISVYSPQTGYFVAVFDDITERKRAEAELRARELRYKAVTNSAIDALVTSDAAGGIVGWNASAERIFGYAETEAVGQPLTLLMPQRFQDRHLNAMKRVQSGGERRVVGKVVELVGRRKDATEFPLELSLAEWAVGEDGFFTGFVRDITERKQAERELVEAEARFRGLVEQSFTGIFVVQDKKLAYCNPRFAQILGYASEAELTGKDLLSIPVEKDVAAAADTLRRLFEEETCPVSRTFAAARKDGSIIELGVQGIRATYLGRPAILGMMQDISEKKRAEEQLQSYIAQIGNAFMSTVQVITTLGEMRDPYTAGHQRRVAEIAVAIGAELGFDARRQEGLRVAGYLHDVGKIRIPSEILSKPGKLSATEFQLVQVHAQASYDVLKDVKFPWPVAEVALQHHERMDGSGYPQGLKGEAILLEARIMAVADVVEAMSSHRPYRPGLGIDKALAEIERGRGSIYDTEVADACLRLFRDRGYQLPV